MTPLVLLIGRRRAGPPSMVLFLPAFWLLVPGAAGLIGVTAIVGTNAARSGRLHCDDGDRLGDRSRRADRHRSSPGRARGSQPGDLGGLHRRADRSELNGAVAASVVISRLRA